MFESRKTPHRLGNDAAAYSTDKATADSTEWTEAKNRRRCELVDKEIDETISAEEARELQQLQSEMLAYRRLVAPLPLKELRELHQELLEKAQRRSTA